MLEVTILEYQLQHVRFLRNIGAHQTRNYLMSNGRRKFFL